MRTAVLSCGALAREVRQICNDGSLHADLFFVKPLLHLYPARLRDALETRLSGLQEEYERTLVVYGQCLPEIDEFLARYGAQRVPGDHCLEMIGGERFWAVARENPGTYFLIPSWTVNFDEAIVTGLQLDREPRMKAIMFRHYTQIVYFDTLLYGDLDARVQEIASYLELPLRIERTGVEELRSRLANSLEQLA